MALIDKVNRRNDALERATRIETRQGGTWGGMRASTDVTPMPDDETYAARYHRAFQTKSETGK